MNSLTTATSLLALAGTLAAQTSYSYSPVNYATVEATTSTGVPFTATTRGPGYRMQQVHGDLKGKARVLTALSFRRDGVKATGTTGNARTLDMALSVGDASYSGVGPNFAANYIGAPKVAIARKNVVTPDWKTQPVAQPAPFDFTLVFDNPVLHTGINDFLYDVQIWSNSAATTDTFTADAASPAFANAATTMLGTPCTTVGAPGPYNLLGTIGALSSGEYRMGPQGFYTPTTSVNVLLFGLSDPNTAVPGLCTNIRSSGEVILPMPTSAGGLWTMPLTYFAGNPAWAGAVVYWQGVSIDPSQSGIGVSLSHGVKLTLQAIPTVPPFVSAKRYSNGISATATDAESVSDGALVIQLSH